MSEIMSDKDFINFINTSTSKGGTTINFKTQNISKKAQNIFKDTPYTALAKQHISASTKNGYYNSEKVKNKFHEIAKEYGITIIA